jgi:hypothetical protein
MFDGDPLRAVQKQIGAMSSRIVSLIGLGSAATPGMREEFTELRGS